MPEFPLSTPGVQAHDLDGLRTALEELRLGHENGRHAVNLVPSETRLSPLSRIPLSHDFYNRYFFNDALDPTFWQFRGGQSVSHFETAIALPSLARLARADHVNLRPISGMSAMLVAMSGLGGEPGNTVVSIAADSGGHYATTAVARRLGFTSLTVPVDRGRVDDGALRAVLRAARPRLVYLDLQNSRHRLDLPPVVAAIRATSPETLLHVDCSHPLGLILGGVFPNPLDDGAESMGGSTHKTFPGPHKGVLFTRRADIRDRLREAQFNLLSSHHFAETIALGLAATEFEYFGSEYAAQVLLNARFLGRELLDRGYDVVTDADHVTSTHQVWVRAGDQTAVDELAGALYAGGIRVNVQVDLPGVPGPALRLGVNEFTFEGAREEAMTQVADAFVAARAGRPVRVRTAVRAARDTLAKPFFFAEFADAMPTSQLVHNG